MLERISLILKKGALRPVEAADVLCRHLKKQGITISLDHVDPESQAVVVVGGDGTLLHVAARAYHLGLPLLGINAGSLGFLTEIRLDEMKNALDDLINERIEIDRRMMLAVTVKSRKHDDFHYFALNDAVITKGALGRMITLPAWAGDTFLCSYRGDGLIISTATGSTAYNLSAGGPIIHPALESMVITPICPFALSSRPLLLPGSCAVTINIEYAPQEISLIVDGQVGRELHEGDRIIIEKAPGYLKLISSPQRDYFAILREKLGWTEGVKIENA